MKFVLTKVWIRKNMYLNVGFAIGVLVLLLESSERKTVFGLLVGGGRAQHIVHGDIYIYINIYIYIIYIYIRISQGSWHAASGSQELPDSEGPWYLKKGFPVFPHVLRSPKSSTQREHLHNKWNPMDQIAEIQHFYGDVIYNVYIIYIYLILLYIYLFIS